MLNFSNGRPPPLFIAESLKLAVTLKSRENRAFADCSPHKDQTVRHSNPTARTAMIACQSRPLEPRADYQHTMGELSAAQNSECLETKTFLTKTGSDLWTVRSQGANHPPYNLGQHPMSRMVLFEHKPKTGGSSAPRSRPSAGLFPAKPSSGKMLITFSSEHRIR